MAATRQSARAKKATPPATAPEPKFAQAHEIALSQVTMGAVGIQAWCKFAGEPDLGELIKDLRAQVKEVVAGDMGQVEAMLYGQATTLQTIFTNLARRAANQEYLKQFQTHLTLALKAQSQCRATLEALAEIKSPRPVAFVRQANISGGHQQVVNNHGPGGESGTIRAGAPAPAEENPSRQNELLEDDSKPNERSAPKEVHPAEMR